MKSPPEVRRVGRVAVVVRAIPAEEEKR